MRTKLVVINNHTLATLKPSPTFGLPLAWPLASSVIRGSNRTCPLSAMDSILIGSTDNVRLANAKDFDEFRVQFTERGWANKKEYEYAE